MAKKYLSIEEAARILGMDPKELNRLREKGDIRAFADRGTWKFRQDEIEELSRSRQPDSSPDVQLGDYNSPKDLSETVFFEEGSSSSDSGIDLGNEDAGALGEQPTIIRRNPLGDRGSDSDVRLIIDEKFQPAPAPGGIDMDDSDSDVKLKLDSDDSSDSDVKLVGADRPSAAPDLGHSDSDVRLAPQKGRADAGSDSDVQLISPKPKNGSDSDVALVKSSKPSKPASGKGKAGAKSDDVLALDFDLNTDDASDGSFVLGAEQSGISLGASDSGISLDAGGSGIALDAGDSGISLDIGDSGIALDADSGITLAGDSGISLAGPSDSGIGLEIPSGPKSGKKLGNQKRGGRAQADDDDELGGTIPMMPTYGLEEKLGDTQMEVPLLGGKEDSDFEFASNALDDETDSTNVIMLDGDDSSDDRAATIVKKGRKDPDEDLDDSVFDVQDSDDDAAVADDDLEVADDVLGEDDELEEMEDVFGADDDDFDEDMQSGQSHADFVAPVGRMSAPVEVEWGGDALAGLGISTVLMAVTGWVMYDLVRTMWSGAALSAPTSSLLDTFKGMFG